MLLTALILAVVTNVKLPVQSLFYSLRRMNHLWDEVTMSKAVREAGGRPD
jgi:hypothetical protein